MMVPLDRPHLTLLHGCLFRFVAYDAGFAYLRFALNVIGWRCDVVGFETDFHSKFTIILWHNMDLGRDLHAKLWLLVESFWFLVNESV